MTDTVLQVDGVEKCYATYRSNAARFLTWFGVFVRPEHEYWAVKNVSFALRSGEALALIGQNGAGKSTLLKMVAGTVRPSAGSIHVAGRISAILELGLGFNPEFTGRQNIYLSGGLMGIPASRIGELIPEIEEFAELGEFFEQPLRVYSSGMQARLAFSLATAVRPEVLIIDEVLSVGDSYFQHKSFDRIRRFKEQGTAILFVSHSLSDVRSICDRVILLDHGAVLKDGLPDEVVDYYNALIAEREHEKLVVDQQRNEQGWSVTKSGTNEAVIDRLVLLDADNDAPVATARVGQNLKLQAHIAINEDVDTLVLGYMLRDRLGHVIWGSNTWHTNQRLTGLKKGQKVTIDLVFPCNLGPGSYSFSPALVSSDTHLENNYEWTDNALVFDVINAGCTDFIGCNWLDVRFNLVVNG